MSNALGTLSLAGAALAVVLLLVMASPAGRNRLAHAVAGQHRWLLAVAWAVAAVSMAGSLYYSDVAGLRPCLLCWYQRIAMYPLVLVLGAAVLADDEEGWRYVLPLSVVGFLISAYHTAIELRPNLSVVECAVEVPCTLRYFAVFGFISIAVMAGFGFLLVTALALTARLAAREDLTEELVAEVA